MQALRTRFVEGPTSVAQARGAAELAKTQASGETERAVAGIGAASQLAVAKEATNKERVRIQGEIDALTKKGLVPGTPEHEQIVNEKIQGELRAGVQSRNLARVEAAMETYGDMQIERYKARTAPEETAPAGAVPSVPVPPEAGMEATQQAETPDIATGAPQGATIAPQDEQAYDWAKTHMNDPTQGIKAKGILNGLKQKYKWL